MKSKQEIKTKELIERNPAYYCMGNHKKYLGFRGFCSKKCHDDVYNEFFKENVEPKNTIVIDGWEYNTIERKLSEALNYKEIKELAKQEEKELWSYEEFCRFYNDVELKKKFNLDKVFDFFVLNPIKENDERGYGMNVWLGRLGGRSGLDGDGRIGGDYGVRGVRFKWRVKT